MEINSTFSLPFVYLMTNIIVHTIASITIKIQRRRAVLMQANVSLMLVIASAAIVEAILSQYKATEHRYDNSKSCEVITVPIYKCFGCI